MSINWKAIPEGLKVFGHILDRNKSTILVGAGLLGWVGTAVLVGQAAPKAQTAVNKAKRDKETAINVVNEKGHEVIDNWDDIKSTDLTTTEIVKATWKYYIPAAVTGVASSAAIIYAHKIDLSKVASLMTSYQLSKGELKKLKDKIVEKDGDKKLKEYEKDVHRDVLVSSPPSFIYNTGKGTTVFFDPCSHMYFYSDIWHVQRALGAMLDEVRNEGSSNLEELRDDLGLPPLKLLNDYAFFYDGISDITHENLSDLFEYHSIDEDNGDLRPCIWLNIEDRVYNVCDMGRGSFRSRAY